MLCISYSPIIEYRARKGHPNSVMQMVQETKKATWNLWTSYDNTKSTCGSSACKYKAYSGKKKRERKGGRFENIYLLFIIFNIFVFYLLETGRGVVYEIMWGPQAWEGVLSLPFLQLRKLQLWEGKWFPQSHREEFKFQQITCVLCHLFQKYVASTLYK